MACPRPGDVAWRSRLFSERVRVLRVQHDACGLQLPGCDQGPGTRGKRGGRARDRGHHGSDHAQLVCSGYPEQHCPAGSIRTSFINIPRYAASEDELYYWLNYEMKEALRITVATTPASAASGSQTMQGTTVGTCSFKPRLSCPNGGQPGAFNIGQRPPRARHQHDLHHSASLDAATVNTFTVRPVSRPAQTSSRRGSIEMSCSQTLREMFTRSSWATTGRWLIPASSPSCWVSDGGTRTRRANRAMDARRDRSERHHRLQAA